MADLGFIDDLWFDRRGELDEEMRLADLIKASFGGDRSAAGRYAAEQRWKNHNKKEEERKGRGAKSPLAQSIIEANESLEKAGLTVRVMKITKRDTELSKRLQKSVQRAAKIVGKSKNFAPFTQERWFFEAVNLMKSSVEFEDYGEYNYRSASPAGQFVIVVEKGNHIVGAMRYDPKIVQARGGVIPTAGSLRVAKGVGTAMFGEVIKMAAKMKVPAIKIEALNTAEGFWKALGFRRVEGAKLKENQTYDMIMDSDTVKTLAKEISS